MFINFSNHASSNWNTAQKAAAEKWGNITDLAFPAVDPAMTGAEVAELAQELFVKIKNMLPSGEKNVVMCSGEFSLAFGVAERLLNENITTVCATTKRVTKEFSEDGKTQKKSVFEFVAFREYLKA